jgi:hypothetical protein
MKTAAIYLILSVLLFSGDAGDQASQKPIVKGAVLTFRALPLRRIFKPGENIIYILSIRNYSADPIFVSRLASDEFVDFKVYGPDGKEVRWQGKGRIDRKSYAPSDFAVLKSGEKISARRTISLKNGQGFIIDKFGRYSVMAEYSLEPPEYFSPLAGSTRIPHGSFGSVKTAFCLKTCSNSQE